MDGDQFRLSRSSSAPSAGPPRDKIGSARYAAHLPFQVFCCESGTHVVDPVQSYYRGITYRNANNFHNLSSTEAAPEWDPEGACMDSSQAWFCRDLWADAAKDGLRLGNGGKRPAAWPIGEDGKSATNQEEVKHDTPAKSPESEKPAVVNEKKLEGAAQAKDDKKPDPLRRREEEKRQQIAPAAKGGDPDANAGSDYDAMDDQNSPPPLDQSSERWTVPNSDFTPARILVNPRCVTTYAGVSHTQLALDLFGPDKEDDSSEYAGGKYVLDDWEGAPDSFVCQEQRYVLDFLSWCLAHGTSLQANWW